jgi:branched-chain amino acid transport system ATP-binding protein
MHVLELRGITKKFGGLQVLGGLDLRIDAGEIFGLVGANGSGKTTLVNLVAGQLAPDRGVVIFVGRDVTSESVWVRAEGIGRIFQESRLWPTLTVSEHFALAAREPMALDILSLLEFSQHLLPRRPTEIRLLDRRRIELAIALSRRPTLLLVDEIGAGLHDDEAQRLYRYIGQLVTSHLTGAVMIIEHRLGLLQSTATQIGLLEDGRIAHRAGTTPADDLEAVKHSLFAGRQTERRGIGRDREASNPG